MPFNLSHKLEFSSLISTQDSFLVYCFLSVSTDREHSGVDQIILTYSSTRYGVERLV